MLARLALESEAAAVVELARQQVAETLPHLDFDPSVAHRTFQNYLTSATPTIFVAEGPDRAPVGFLMALISDYAFTRGFFVGQEAIFVRKDQRGGPAASSLMKAYDEWARRLEPREIYAGVANGMDVDRTVRFFQHLGFAPVGTVLRKVA